MIEAEKKGTFSSISNQMDFVSAKEAKQWRFASYGNDLAQSYRLYTLALAGAPDLSSMNRLRNQRNERK
jgi:hypothetical protein